LKKIGEELWGILDIGIKTPLLKERLWHTFFEVMWGVIIGAWLTVLMYRTSSDIQLYFSI
jgi:acid phosphatase family membrane protein YuiD